MRVLFVCLGNICRSPMAEGIFNQLLKQHQLTDKVSCDSAGIASYHIDCRPDLRAQQICTNHGIELNHKARLITAEDFMLFNFIVAMDRSVLDHLKRIAPEEHQAELVLMRSYDTQSNAGDVPDPYYGTIHNFQEVYELLTHTCNNFVQQHLLT